MRIARFLSGGQELYGVVEGEQVRVIEGDIFSDFKAGQQSLPLAGVRLLPPVRPSKILAVALNYRSHLGERPASPHPELFLKAPSSLIGPEETIILPQAAGRVDYEGELVVVMGRR